MRIHIQRGTKALLDDEASEEDFREAQLSCLCPLPTKDLLGEETGHGAKSVARQARVEVRRVRLAPTAAPERLESHVHQVSRGIAHATGIAARARTPPFTRKRAGA